MATATWAEDPSRAGPDADAAVGTGATEAAGGTGRIGGYELREELGRGGMGVVYRARQSGLGRDVALKVLRLGPWAGGDARERFRREAAAAAALRHPNVVTVFDVGEADGHAYLAMELVAGRSLAELANGKPLEPDRAARYVQRVAEAVAAAHARGILHRDLKPANVLVDADDEPRVTDFGLAKWLETDGGSGSGSGGAVEVTRAGQVLGSPGYLPPEQADAGRGPVGFASDVYALGALLYHLLTGRPPFAGATLTATLAQVLRDDPAPPRRLHSAVPRDLETICLQCLRKEPGSRYASANEVAGELAAFREHRPIRARPVSPLEKAWLGCRRRPALAALALVVLLVSAAGTAGVLWQAAENRRNLHAADLRLASQAVQDGDLGRARALLEAHRPRRGEGDFTWRLLRHESEGEPRQLLGSHPWIVSAVAWSPDGRRLASASVGSGTVGADLRVWSDPGAGAAAAPVILAPMGGRQIFWFPDNRRLLVAHLDGLIREWDVEAKSASRQWPGRSAGLSADGRWLAVCGGDPYGWSDQPTNGPVRVFDLAGAGSFELPASRLVAMSPAGDRIARCDLVGRAWIHSRSEPTATPRELTTEGSVWALTFSPDGRFLVATGFDRQVRVWRLDEAGSVPRRLNGHEAWTWGAAFAADGSWLATTASDQSVRLWETATWAPLGALRGHGSEVWCVGFSPDRRRLVSGGKDRSVVVWNAAIPEAERTLEARGYGAAFFSPDGRRLLTESVADPRTALVHELEGGSPRAPARVPALLAVGFGTGSNSLYAAADYQLFELDGDGRRRAERALEHDRSEKPVAVWAADLRVDTVAAAVEGGAVLAWDGRTGRLRGRHPVPGLVPWRLAISPDGAWLVVTAGEQGFHVGPTGPGGMRSLRGHADQAKDAAFSPDSRWLATASVDGTVKLWEVRTGEERGTLRGHRSEVTAVAFAPDGVTLASAEMGHGIRLWNLPTRREVAVLPIPDMGEWLGFSPDGRVLAARLDGGRMRLFRAP